MVWYGIGSVVVFNRLAMEGTSLSDGIVRQNGCRKTRFFFPFQSSSLTVSFLTLMPALCLMGLLDRVDAEKREFSFPFQSSEIVSFLIVMTALEITLANESMFTTRT